ncbi:hypothetical protein FQZ97_1210430 [compost metagenome]
MPAFLIQLQHIEVRIGHTSDLVGIFHGVFRPFRLHPEQGIDQSGLIHFPETAAVLPAEVAEVHIFRVFRLVLIIDRRRNKK